MNTNTLPEPVEPEHLTYLDNLRSSGVTNMFGALPFLMEAFPGLSKKDATWVLGYWMQTFSERHPS
jgi:hypothetical protein